LFLRKAKIYKDAKYVLVMVEDKRIKLSFIEELVKQKFLSPYSLEEISEKMAECIAKVERGEKQDLFINGKIDIDKLLAYILLYKIGLIESLNELEDRQSKKADVLTEYGKNLCNILNFRFYENK